MHAGASFWGRSSDSPWPSTRRSVLWLIPERLYRCYSTPGSLEYALQSVEDLSPRHAKACGPPQPHALGVHYVIKIHLSRQLGKGDRNEPQIQDCVPPRPLLLRLVRPSTEMSQPTCGGRLR